VRRICFVFDIILHTAYTADTCTPTSILYSLSLPDMIHCMAGAKAKGASVEGVGVDFQIDMDSVIPQRCESCL
jgi:hypothetical protein